MNRIQPTTKPHELIKSSINPHHSWLLRKLISTLNAANITAIHIVTKSGDRIAIGHPNSDVAAPVIKLKRNRAILKSSVNGLLGWAESYMAGDWECDSLITLTDWAMYNEDALRTAFAGRSISALINRIWHRLNDNSKRGSRKNIAYHYDLGNNFYQEWLDETMTYSSALYEDTSLTLAQAQNAKYQRILSMSEAKSGDRILEIGCGWGGFAETVSEQDNLSLYGVTLSKEQLAYANHRVAQLEANDRIKLAFQDYRDIDQTFERIVSIEMFEAVGEAHWDTYFQKLYTSLKPGGTAVLQIICIEPKRFENYRNNADFIQRYIFPGGMLPTAEKVRDLTQAHGMHMEEQLEFGLDYAETLRQWRETFMQRWESIKPQGYDERFKRMWEYYLAYCESGFRYRSIDVRLFKIRKPLCSSLLSSTQTQKQGEPNANTTTHSVPTHGHHG
ncbi:class I SAM-dependent methyltransferase [Neptunomonas phycophila]|uniref:class I SAM-dependent methyltransferase n=1 Tax=Neptunomonas phycophila TaxID=1572645 RepID=UPI003517583B